MSAARRCSPPRAMAGTAAPAGSGAAGRPRPPLGEAGGTGGARAGAAAGAGPAAGLRGVAVARACAALCVPSYAGMWLSGHGVVSSGCGRLWCCPASAASFQRCLCRFAKRSVSVAGGGSSGTRR